MKISIGFSKKKVKLIGFFVRSAFNGLMAESR